MRTAGTVALIGLLTVPPPASSGLECLETGDLRLVYIAPLYSYLAPHVARCFENSMRTQRLLFDYEPSEKVTVILGDFADYGNAGAGAVPRNGLVVSIAPSSFAYETYPANERMNTLMNHELVHVANFDRPAGPELVFRGLFSGKVAATADHPETILYSHLTAPRAGAPRWFHEGIAVFAETWMAGGIGRAQGPYDEMVFRSMVLDGSRFYDPLGLVAEGTKVDFQLELNSYLYGTRFVSWVAWKHSPERLLEWVTRARGSRAPYGAQFEKVFGCHLDEAWKEWVAFEHVFQQANLDSLRQYPLTRYEDISGQALGSISRAFLDPEAREIYAGLNYPGHVAHVAAIGVDDGSLRRLAEIKGPMMYAVTSLAFDPEHHLLYYTADNGAWRDIVELDPRSRKRRTVLEDARIGDLAFDRSDRSLWGIRHYNGIATLVHIPYPLREWHQVHSFAYGVVLFDLDVSPDGRLLAAGVAEPEGRSEVRVFETEQLRAGDLEPVARFDFGVSTPCNFVFSPEGRFLYGSSYYTGVSNVARYDLETGALEFLTNTETGFFRPIPPATDGRLIAFRYSGEGFVPAWVDVEPLEDIAPIRLLGARLREEHPQLAQWRAGSPAKVPLDSLVSYRGEYRALRSMELESVYPVVEGYKSWTAIGLRMNLSDPVSLHRIHVTTSASPSSVVPDDERVHLELQYRRYDWRVIARHNRADFYDLVGPTKVSRKGTSLGVGYTRMLIRDSPRELELGLDLIGYTGLESLPDYQNVSVSYRDLISSSVHLGWRNLRFSLGAVDYEKGVKGTLGLAANWVNGRAYPSVVGTFDAGIPLFFHSSLWLRSAAGAAPPEREEAFSNFFLGGFGNNWVDHGEVRRYREWYAMPGFELNELFGTNFVKLTGDWNLPPIRFRRLGTPSFHASWIRSGLFATGLATNIDRADLRQGALSAGAQLDLRLTLFNHLDFTASAGWATGIREGERNDELMISLKVL